MSKKYLLGTIVVLTAFLTLGVAYAQQPPQEGPPQEGGWYCPWCGGSQGPGYYGMGPGMMRGYGGYGMGPQMMYRYGMGPEMMYRYGMGPGMMRGYYGMGPGRMYGYGGGPGMGYHHGYGMPERYGQQGSKPLSEEQVKQLVKNYVQNTHNPNLQVGKITKPSGKDYYVAQITTKDGSLVDKIEVNEYTGWFRSAYEQ